MLAAAIVPAQPAHADIFKYVDKNGHVYLTDRPNHPGYKLLVKTWKGWTESRGRIDFRRVELNRKRFGPAIRQIAREYQLPDALLHAVIKAESYYDPNAVSRAGAVGLMQLMPGTAQRYGVRDRRDPLANMHGGSRYLRDLLGMFNNNVVLALAAYNAGENAVIQNGYKIPPYSETRTYVKKVLQFYRENRTQVM
ncbi:MAG: transglycosylase SLT domain-containing protein [Phycisphaerales bacterium]|nr:transglycosylase SLT domain-containing protein [Phycisphaerales bacterium]MCC7410375.1 transglycosylase SLT domain-containing protein [Gammaproteobacteria bacterium]